MTPQKTEHILSTCHAFAKYEDSDAFANVKRRIQKRQATRRRLWGSASAVAAILVLALILWPPYQHITNDSNSPLLVQLPDQSQVTLNKGASIVFAKHMQHKRRLTLKGESFFSITADAKHPFVIKAGTHQVKVLGTSFNVKYNENDEALEVWVKSGTVAVSQGNKPELMLSSGEFARGRNGQLLNIPANTLDPNYLSWYQQKLVFNAQPLAYVLSTIAQTYHILVKVNDKTLNDLKLSTTFEGLSSEEVLTSICLTLNLKMKKEGEHYVLYQE